MTTTTTPTTPSARKDRAGRYEDCTNAYHFDDVANNGGCGPCGAQDIFQEKRQCRLDAVATEARQAEARKENR